MNDRRWTRHVLRALGALAALYAGFAQANNMKASLADMTLEQLSNIVITSVSRRDEPLARAAASVFVVTAEDIRRFGATSLPEALRLAPNLDVARADANQYAISARGFTNVHANKLLVLLDGRTVYTPLFSGTFWEAQDVMLEDVERIEVVSGPGGTLWGANAVNGVINVVTKSAAATHGTLAALTGGSAQRDAALRHGGELPGGHWRAYGKAVRRDNTRTGTGAPIRDFGEHLQTGFRVDLGKPAHGLTFQGDAYEGSIRGLGREFSGLNLLGRWTHDLGEAAQLKAQAYFDRTSRNHPGVFIEHLDTWDFELQHALRPRGRHRLLWGFGLRRHRSDATNTPNVVWTPEDRTLARDHVFVQDQIQLAPALELTLGAKVETNTYSGAEFLPSARIAWHPSATRLAWAALSRAVRAPSRVDRDLSLPGTVAGGPNSVSEVSTVWELGYRGQPIRTLSYSVTAFYHDHERLRTVQPAAGGGLVRNDREGQTYGVEGWTTWRPADWWRLSAGLTRLRQKTRLLPGAGDASTPGAEGNDPRGWWRLRASFDLTPRHELDVMLRHTDARPSPAVPAYTALDARLGWRMSRDVELSLIVQNLLDRRHPEWGAAATRAELERAAFVRVRIGL